MVFGAFAKFNVRQVLINTEMGLCQNSNFGAVPLGVLELVKCKALRVRTTGVYFRKRLSPNPDNNAAVCNDDTPPVLWGPVKGTAFFDTIGCIRWMGANRCRHHAHGARLKADVCKACGKIRSKRTLF